MHNKPLSTSKELQNIIHIGTFSEHACNIEKYKSRSPNVNTPWS